jgi:PIN domain nuclease of toxin-antitoxin system
MNKKISVLDSSAILAVLNLETGAKTVEPLLPDAIVSSINVAEVLTKLVERNIPLDDALEDFLKLGLEIIEFDVEQAAKVAELRPLTRHLGLSLGDRSCLALAILKNAAAVTADKNWANLNFCKIKVIR